MKDGLTLSVAAAFTGLLPNLRDEAEPQLHQRCVP
jgi:hypothetical protein